jgi:hypothetical protein
MASFPAMHVKTERPKDILPAHKRATVERLALLKLRCGLPIFQTTRFFEGANENAVGS